MSDEDACLFQINTARWAQDDCLNSFSHSKLFDPHKKHHRAHYNFHIGILCTIETLRCARTISPS